MDLIELRRQFDALVHRVVLVESRIVEIAAAAAAIHADAPAMVRCCVPASSGCSTVGLSAGC